MISLADSGASVEYVDGKQPYTQHFISPVAYTHDACLFGPSAEGLVYVCIYVRIYVLPQYVYIYIHVCVYIYIHVKF